MNMNEHMIAIMREATQALRDGRGAGIATEVIQRTLQKFLPAGATMPTEVRAADPTQPAVMRDINPAPKPAQAQPETSPPQARKRAADSANDFIADLLDGMQLPGGADAPVFDMPGLRKRPGTDIEPEPITKGRFTPGSFTNQFGTRGYKLYIPSGYQGQSLPLVVMLHGCTQNPDDFAAGTRMNVIAEEKQCFVVYPAQTQTANNSKCWNWFNGLDQQREQGEPSIIAGITRDLIKTYRIDEHQVFIAGMSAGGAMAVIMGTTYPELYTAVGIHSGLPYASAQDLPSALAAMKGGAAMATAAPQFKGIPIIVFHGDRDKMVHPRNGDQIIAQALPDGAARTAAQSSSEPGKVPNGRAYKRTLHRDSNGHVVAEHWEVHGGGHKWSGGSNRGSYTDPKGPDAGREMMRFFSTQVKAEKPADAGFPNI